MSDFAPEYIEAREVLLDALESLGDQRGAVIIAGAQAVYLRTGESAFLGGVQAYTTDADLVLDPSSIGEDPKLEAAMAKAGLTLMKVGDTAVEPGIWIKPSALAPAGIVAVDLIVPEGLAPPGGRRGARLGTHGNRAARKIRGLEAAVVDTSQMSVVALDPSDALQFDVNVAGLGALFVAKTHKIGDRVEGPEARLTDKDVSDLYRVISTATVEELANIIRALLMDDRSAAVTEEAVDQAADLFRSPTSPGVEMGVRALSPTVPQATVEATFTSYFRELASAL